MSIHSHDTAGVQPDRLALFAGIFVAGLIGGAAFMSALAHSQQVRPEALLRAEPPAAISASSLSDPSVPDAGVALLGRAERHEPAAPTF